MKVVLRAAVGFLYLTVLLISLIVLIKPGASLFYTKSPVDAQALGRDGNAFAYQFAADTRIFDPGSLLVAEDGAMLQKSVPGYTTTEGVGTFAVSGTGENTISILFNPTTPSASGLPERAYTVYIKPHLFSRMWGNAAFLVLLLGLVIAFGPLLADPQKRKEVFASPVSILTLGPGGLRQAGRHGTGASAGSAPAAGAATPSRGASWKQAAVNTILVANLYVLMEWVFFATKPSFMDYLNLGEKVKVLLVTGFELAFIALLALLLVFLLEIPLGRIWPAFHKYALHIPAAVLATCLCLILLDNFTYTMFKVGVVTSGTIPRIVYELGFTGGLVYFLRQMAGVNDRAPSGGLAQAQTVGAFSLFGVTLVLAGLSFNPVQEAGTLSPQVSSASRTPNIILFSSDGMNASHMSVYGYERDTTPFLRELTKQALVGANHFANSDHSLGSETATLTGKLPLATKVYNDTTILTGGDMYLHLPGLLKLNGYRTVQFGVPNIVDANAQNFRDAFDVVNCEGNAAGGVSNQVLGYANSSEMYLLLLIEGRITDRLNHIFFVEDMVDPYKMVTEENNYYVSDKKRLDCLYGYLNETVETGQPLFAHVHLMGTHGSRFEPEAPTFSQGKEQMDGWMTDFYDDSILDLDSRVHRLVEYLIENDLYDNTILIVYTDHGQKYTTIDKLPLIMRFPNDQYAGIITENTQNLDIAPTILDYMGIQKPEWMGGSSLLARPVPKRLIFASGQVAAFVDRVEAQHPFALPGISLNPQIKLFPFLTVTQCQRWYVFDLNNMIVSEGEVGGYAQPCPVEKLDSREAILEQVRAVLAQHGYVMADD